MASQANIKLYIQYATIVLTTATLVFGAIQFVVSIRQNLVLELRKTELADQQVIRQRKVKLYLDISEAVGQLSAHTDLDTAFRKAAEQFRKLYYGDGKLLLANAAQEQMERFNFALTAYLDGNNPSATQLKTAGQTLMIAIRPLMPLEKDPQTLIQ